MCTNAFSAAKERPLKNGIRHFINKVRIESYWTVKNMSKKSSSGKFDKWLFPFTNAGSLSCAVRLPGMLHLKVLACVLHVAKHRFFRSAVGALAKTPPLP
jgi:hypothetical protein